MMYSNCEESNQPHRLPEPGTRESSASIMPVPIAPKRRVLIVDDSPHVRDSLASLAARIAKVDVVGLAEDGEHGLTLFAKTNPDVVLLDLELPGITGIEVLRKIREQSSECVVIVLTSYAFSSLRQRCLSLGADHFLDKAAEFSEAIRLLGQAQLLKPLPGGSPALAQGKPQKHADLRMEDDFD